MNRSMIAKRYVTDWYASISLGISTEAMKHCQHCQEKYPIPADIEPNWDVFTTNLYSRYKHELDDDNYNQWSDPDELQYFIGDFISDKIKDEFDLDVDLTSQIYKRNYCDMWMHIGQKILLPGSGDVDCRDMNGVEKDKFINEMRLLLDSDCQQIEIIEERCKKAKKWLETLNGAPINFTKFHMIPLVQVSE